MGRKPTGRTTKLVRVPIKFEQEVKAFITLLKEQEQNKKTTSKEIG